MEKRRVKPGKRGSQAEWGTCRPVEAWREVKARFRKFRINHTLVWWFLQGVKKVGKEKVGMMDRKKDSNSTSQKDPYI